MLHGYLIHTQKSPLYSIKDNATLDLQRHNYLARMNSRFIRLTQYKERLTWLL